MGRSIWTSAGFNRSTSSCLSWKCGSKDVQGSNQRLGTQRHDYVPNTSRWSQHRLGARFQNSWKKCKDEVNEKRSAVHKKGQKQSSGGSPPLSPAPATETSWKETLARRAQGMLIETISSQADEWKVCARRVRWTWLLGESVKSFGLAWLCVRHGHEVWTQV